MVSSTRLTARRTSIEPQGEDFDVVIIVFYVELLTTLGSVQEGHMVLFPNGVSQPLALAGI